MSATRALLIGNSRWHWAVQQPEGHPWRFDHAAPTPQQINTTDLIWAAVGEVPEALHRLGSSRLKLEHVPLQGCPPWLGIDRALGAWGAWTRQLDRGGPAANGLLLVDAGTVLSLTLLDRKGRFSGGRLLPGMRLQLQAMNAGTALLPVVEADAVPEQAFPIETADAMRSGVMQGMVAAVVEAQRTSGARLWLCGGDAPWLAMELSRRGLSLDLDQDLQLQAMVALRSALTPAPGR
ncbi:MAG: type III pantothenate kinase [Synechococcus sp.]|nr:type III pantothenate kinase [Synechococcus sp.]